MSGHYEAPIREPLIIGHMTYHDISNDIATVKVTQNKMNFIDYLHLSKIENEWKIINVLWARTN